MELQHVLTIIFTLAIAVIGYLLAQKDASQGKLIDDLYEKHNADADRLQKLEVDVAKNSYSKLEINAMFADMKLFIVGQFDRLEENIKEVRRTRYHDLPQDHQ